MVRSIGLVCALLVCGALTAAADITVRLDPVPITIPGVGEQVLVNIMADIPETEAILGWGMDLELADGGIADWTLVSIGASFDAYFAPDGDGLAGLVRPEFRGLSGNDILLATVQFTGLAAGTTAIQGGDSNPPDLTEGFALDPTGFAPVNYVASSLTVVPEPAAALLLVLAGLALRRR